MGEGTELPPVESNEGVSDVQAESISLDAATTDPEAFVVLKMDIAEAEVIQTAFVEAVTLVTEEAPVQDLPQDDTSTTRTSPSTSFSSGALDSVAGVALGTAADVTASKPGGATITDAVEAAGRAEGAGAPKEGETPIPSPDAPPMRVFTDPVWHPSEPDELGLKSTDGYQKTIYGKDQDSPGIRFPETDTTDYSGALGEEQESAEVQEGTDGNKETFPEPVGEILTTPNLKMEGEVSDEVIPDVTPGETGDVSDSGASGSSTEDGLITSFADVIPGMGSGSASSGFDVSGDELGSRSESDLGSGTESSGGLGDGGDFDSGSGPDGTIGDLPDTGESAPSVSASSDSGEDSGISVPFDPSSKDVASIVDAVVRQSYGEELEKLEDIADDVADKNLQKPKQPMEDLSIVAGVEPPDSGLHESIEADLSVSGVSPEESLRDIVSESETELGSASKATGHGVYSKSREIPVSTTGPGGEPEAVVGDLSALGGPKGSDSEGSESEGSEPQQQPPMEGLSFVTRAESENLARIEFDETEVAEGIDTQQVVNDLNSELKDKYDDLKSKVSSHKDARESAAVAREDIQQHMEDLSIVAGVEIPAVDIPESEESKSDLEIWEENEPVRPDPSDFDLSTDEGKKQYDAAMEGYQNKYAAWQAAKPPDEGDDDDRGGDSGSRDGETSSIPGGSVLSDATSGIENLKDSSGG